MGTAAIGDDSVWPSVENSQPRRSGQGSTTSSIITNIRNVELPRPLAGRIIGQCDPLRGSCDPWDPTAQCWSRAAFQRRTRSQSPCWSVAGESQPPHSRRRLSLQSRFSRPGYPAPAPIEAASRRQTFGDERDAERRLAARAYPSLTVARQTRTARAAHMPAGLPKRRLQRGRVKTSDLPSSFDLRCRWRATHSALGTPSLGNGC